MASVLARLGAWSFRRAWFVIIAWLLACVAALGGAFAIGPDLREEFVIPGTESQAALDRLDAVFPEVAGASVQLVIHDPAGDIADFESEIGAVDDALRDIDGVENVLGPWDEYANDQVSADGAYARVTIQLNAGDEAVAQSLLDDIVAAGEPLGDEGLDYAFGGQVFEETSVAVSAMEIIGVVIAGVVLVITFGSFVAAGLPLISAVLGVGITMGLMLIVSAFVTISNSAPILALMTGLAVGIDYALFILFRHRTQLAHGEDPEGSAAHAVGTAGTAVVFAGVTVIVALLGLMVVGIPFLSVMGVGGAAAVAVAVCGAVTLLPAIMGVLGERMRPKPGSRAAKVIDKTASGRTMGHGWVRFVTRVPALTIVAVVAVLGVASVPAFSLQLALPDNGDQPVGTGPRDAYEMLQAGFGEGSPGVIVVMADITQTTEIEDVLNGLRDDLADIPGVVNVGPGIPDSGLDTAIFQITSEFEPSSPETEAVVHALRDAAPELGEEYDVELSVTGMTAVAIDISERLATSIVPLGALVVGLAFVILMLVFRSLLVPLAAALGFVLSLMVAIGATVAAFQWGWVAPAVHMEAGPILSFMPVILMAVLFGLAMDYQVFLVAGMREAYVHGASPRDAVVKGFTVSARVVTAAALIMFFVFGMFVPEGAQMMKAIAFGLAVGVAVDAFVIRMTLMPALLALMGKSAWWLPKWLDRMLPSLDVEGEVLARRTADLEWVKGREAEIVLDGLRVGEEAPESPALRAAVPRGAVLRVSGTSRRRALLSATLAGRLIPASGRLIVTGAPLPSDASIVRRRVALVHVDSDESWTIAEALDAAPRVLVVDADRPLDAAERARLAAAPLTTTIVVAAPESASLTLTGRTTVDLALDDVAPATRTLEHS